MSGAVLDSSAVLAVILEESGAERVEMYLPGGMVSAVNLGEVAKLRDLGMPAQTVEAVLDGLQIDIRPHDRSDALGAGLLRPATRAARLSLGLPAITADRSWQGVAADVGVEVTSIR